MDRDTQQILLELLASMKLRAGHLFEIAPDVEGLKAALPEERREVFERRKQSVRGEGRIAFEGEIRSLDAAILRLRNVQID